MAQIGFIGLGKMGLPMAQNLVKAGHAVSGFDAGAAALEAFAAGGGVVTTAIDVACFGADVVVSMLSSGTQVREVYLGQGGVLASASQGTLLIDCSTIDIDTARAVEIAAKVNSLDMVDAPAIVDLALAQEAALTFLVGGGDAAVERARPV